MLVDAFEKLQKNGFVRLLQQYFSSVAHMAVVAILALVSALFALEIPVFYCFLVLSLLVLFFGKDITGMLPILGCGYMCLSYRNSPVRFPETSILVQGETLLQIGYCVGVIVLLTVIRLVYTLVFYPPRRAPRFGISLGLLAVSYILGGAFSAYYGANTVLFGLLNVLVLCFPYFVFCYGIDWQTCGKEYIFKLLTVVGVLVAAQIVAMLFREGVIVDGAVSDRGMLYFGWAHYNTAGCMMAMCAVAPLYFAATKKRGWLFTVLAFVFLCGVVLTQSRGSILFGAVVFAGALVVTLIKAQKRERIFSLVVVAVFAVAVIVCGLCFFEKVKSFFASMLQHGTDDNGRLELFRKAWEYFCANPVFGVGWGGENWQENTDIFWYFMAHNTLLQLLASLGIVGTLIYGYHRVQTCVVLFKKPSPEKTFCALIAAVLLLTCMMDCHLFSCVPPVLFYSVLLAFMEGTDIKAGVDTRLRLKRKKQIA